MNSAAENLSAPSECEVLLTRMLRLREQIVTGADRRLRAVSGLLGQGVPDASALNLAHYLSLREQELRKLQSQLSDVGLSSLGRGETHVLANVDQVIAWLRGAVFGTGDPFTLAPPARQGDALLARRTDALFGPAHPTRATRIMVTLPGEAASDYALVRELLATGMDCARINCAHDDRAVWKSLIDHVRRAAQEAGRECRIMMDLAGPKIRTGSPLSRKPPVLHFNPPHDDYGHVTEPAIVAIRGITQGTSLPAWQPGVLHVPASLIDLIEKHDRINFVDCRGKKRTLYVSEWMEDRGEWVGHCWRNAYLSPGRLLTLERKGSASPDRYETIAQVELPPFSGQLLTIKLMPGDLLKLVDRVDPGVSAFTDLTATLGGTAQPPMISCTMAGLGHMVKPGQQVWIDDGKIGANVESVETNGILLRITETGGRAARLHADKGINFPGANFTMPAITAADRSDLEFVIKHADMVAMSFIRRPEDVAELMRTLEAAGARAMPIILKIETCEAVKCLPDILFQSLTRGNIGVMIARGDLAVEIGAVRLAEMQEEILWLCEAAHLPVIWATQVLDTLAKKGVTSRPEITDAAMGVRAECVMLNKGPRIMVAVHTLAEILTRMQAHQHKKFSLMRALHW